MRISTNTIFDTGTNLMLQQQEALIKTQQQLATGRRILTPADDPIAAAQVVNIAQTISLNDQYAVNRISANSALGLEENALKSMEELLQDVQTSAVYAGNGSLKDTDRKIIATELRSKLEALVGLANSTDEKGQFLFSGFQATTKPFAQTDLVVQYMGDQGQRLNQIGPERQLAVSDSGIDLFERIKDGNGVFTTAADPLNTGTGIINTGSVVAPASLTGDSYELTFTVLAGVTTYDVVDLTTGLPVSVANAYVSSSTISFDGLQFSISGDPADGDKFTVSPSTNESVFTTIGNLITALETLSDDQTGRTRLTNNLNTALQNLNNSLEHILTSRATVGARVQEIESLENYGSDLNIQYQQLVSQLQDVDFAKAASDLQRQQLYLEAAQQSYVKITGLSLFNYI